MRFYRTLFLAIMAIMVIISLVTYYSYRQLSDEYLLLARTESIHSDLERLMYGLEEAEADIRGYLITGDSFYSESLERSKSDIEDRVTSLNKELAEEADVIETYQQMRDETITQLNEMDSLAGIFERDSVFSDDMYRILRAAEDRMKGIRSMNDSLVTILRPGENFITSRTFTPMFIIIGFLVAIAAIIFLYSHLYRSLQSNLSTEIQLEKNLIELGQEIQEREEAELLMERILDNSHSSILLIRPVYKNEGGEITDFRIVKCNRQTEKQTGMSKKDLEGGNLLELFPGVVDTGLFEDYKHTFEDQKAVHRELLYDYDDIHIYIDLRALPLDDGVLITSTDVTEQIRVQKEIQENNQKFSTLFHQAYQFIALIDEDNEITDINESFLEFIQSKSENTVGNNLTNLNVWKGENKELIQQMINRARESGSARQEMLVIDMEGEERYLDLSCTRVPGIDEKRILFEGRDLTELHWAQEENEFLAHLNVSITNAENFNHAAKLVFNQIGKRYELDSTEVWVPEGDSHVRLLSQYLFDPSRKNELGEDPYIMPRGEGIVNNILLNREMVYVPDISKADSVQVQRREFLIEKGYRSLFAIPIVFEGEVLLIAVFLSSEEIEDIEELKNTLKIMSATLGALLIKKKVQDDIKRHNLILNEAERLTKLGSWEWHLEDNSLEWSDGMFRILDLEKDKKPDFDSFFDYVHPEQKEEIQQVILDHVAARSSYELEFRIISPHGGIKHVRATGHPVENNFGTIKSYTGTMQDITAQKNHELELREKNQELLDSNKNLEQFAYIASHDLQEPLRKIRAFGGRLEQKYEGVLDEKGIDYLDRMRSAAERMQVLINDLLKYSRVARNNKPFEMTDLNPIVNGVLTDLEAAIQERGARIKVGELPHIIGDDLQLRQLFQNLISNAIKFVPSDRVPEIAIWSERCNKDDMQKWNGMEDDEYYCLHFRDNGIGVDQKYKERIFGLFERLHGRGEFTGTGIGLAICQKVVQNHGGQVTLESEKDNGTTFKVILPKGNVELVNV